MRARLIPSLVTALGVLVLSVLAELSSNVIGVVSSMGRYPEAMLDYVLPALGGAISLYLLPLVVVSIVVFLGYWLLPVKGSSRVWQVILFAVLTSVVASVLASAQVAARIGISTHLGDGLRVLSSTLAAAGGTVYALFLLVTPLIVIGALLLLFFYRRPARAELTEAPPVG